MALILVQPAIFLLKHWHLSTILDPRVQAARVIAKLPPTARIAGNKTCGSLAPFEYAGRSGEIIDMYATKEHTGCWDYLVFDRRSDNTKFDNRTIYQRLFDGWNPYLLHFKNPGAENMLDLLEIQNKLLTNYFLLKTFEGFGGPVELLKRKVACQ